MGDGDDPGFSGAPTYYSAKFTWKLHEKEENWTGGAHPKFYYVDPPLDQPAFWQLEKTQLNQRKTDSHEAGMGWGGSDALNSPPIVNVACTFVVWLDVFFFI